MFALHRAYLKPCRLPTLCPTLPRPHSADDDLYGLCWNGGFAYAMTQGAKMILLATLLPGSEDMAFMLSQEIFKALLRGSGDLLGMYLTLKKARTGTNQKILAIGLGWACTESVFRNLLPLWSGARGMQFSWEFVFMSLDSNISALCTITLVALTWMLAFGAKGRDAERAQQNQGPLLLLVAAVSFMPVVFSYGIHTLGLNPWATLAAHATSAGAIAVTVKGKFESSKPKAN